MGKLIIKDLYRNTEQHINKEIKFNYLNLYTLCMQESH